jgi:hypothetical protein
MGSFVVVVEVELVDQCLQGLDCLRWWPGVEPLLQRLVESFVLALGCRPVRFAGDGLDPEVEQVVDQLAGEPAAGGVERQPVVGEQPLWDAPAADRGRHDQHCGSGCLAVGDEACGGHPGVVVDDLVNRHAGAIGQRPGERVYLPAAVRGRVDEPAVRRPRPLTRFRLGHASGSERTSQCGP